MKLLIITKLGSYLYLPVNEIPVCRLKDLGKHVSNFVPIDPNDEVVNAYIVDEKDASQVITFFTKEGMVKRTELSSFIVSRYNKTYTSMKLKAGDYITNTQIDNENTLLVTKSGYYISYKTSEIPISSAKSQGVKGINLKDDEVVSGLTYTSEDEYLNIFTDKKTGKRVKLSDLTQLTRAKRGSMVIKKVKSTNYNIVSALITKTNDFVGLSSFESVERIKNTDIPIMDLASTGSSITKKSFDKAFKYSNPVKIEETVAPKKKEEKPKKVDKQEEMEFIEDFKI
jgi:topoisomerase-4 subunit A